MHHVPSNLNLVEEQDEEEIIKVELFKPKKKQDMIFKA